MKIKCTGEYKSISVKILSTSSNFKLCVHVTAASTCYWSSHLCCCIALQASQRGKIEVTQLYDCWCTDTSTHHRDAICTGQYLLQQQPSMLPPKAAYSRGQMDEWSISRGTQRRHRRDLTALRLFFGWTNWLVVGRGDPRAGQWLKQTRTVGQKLVTWWYIADHMAEMGICDPDHIQVFISLPATFF